MTSLLLLVQAAPDDAGVGGLLAGGACMLVAIVLGLIGVALWIWALVHAIKNPALDSNEKRLRITDVP